MPGTFTVSKAITAVSNDYGLGSSNPLVPLGVSIDLPCTKITQTWEKRMSVQPRPATSGGDPKLAKPPINILRDFKIITHNIKIEGWLDDGVVHIGGPWDNTTANAVKKKQYLIAMASQNKPNSNVFLTWRGEYITCALQKLAFDDEWETIAAGDTDQIDSDLPATQPFGKIKFTLTFLIGKAPA